MLETNLGAYGWESCIVVATGPSLTEEQAEKCYGHRVIAVNDAWRMVPFADVLYACDDKWWDVKGCGDFAGERWSCHERDGYNNKKPCALKHGLKLVQSRDGEGFCMESDTIHYGSNSGFQAVNLALQFGAKRIRLLGFDMKANGHFFGPQIPQFHLPQESSFRTFRRAFEVAAKKLPSGIEIVNCTPGSGLKCFPMGEL